jgi:hypothetical protein
VQAKLVSLMGDQLPQYFLAAPPVASDSTTEEQRAFNAFFNIQQKRQANVGAGGGGYLSSSASSTSSHNSGQDSPTLAAVAPSAPLKRVSVGLPARCQYPHAVPGTFYDFINVKRKCLTADVEEAYRRWRTAGYKAAKAIDPAKADAMDRLIVDAKNVLSNPSIRAEYDNSLPPNPTSLCPQQGTTATTGAKPAVKSIATPAVVPLFEGGIWS